MSELTLDLDRYRAQMPSAVAVHTDPSRPPAQRLVAARGMLPLPTQDQLAVLVALADAFEPPVADAARATLQGMPVNLIKPVLTNPSTPGWLLEGLGCRIHGRVELLPDLLSHRNTPDRIHLWSAENVDAGPVHERLTLDLERLKRTPEIIEKLWENESVDRYLLRPPVEFLVREGIVLDSVPLFKEVLASFSFEELQDAVEHVELPDEVQHLIEEKPEKKVEAREEEPEEEGEAERLTLTQIVGKMTPAQKIALALKGNREARQILIRDSNKLVCTAVIRSPRISEREVVMAAQMRSIHEEVIRIICANREWMRKYPIRLALVNNPKTPIGKSMSLIKTLQKRDLKGLTRSTGIPSALRSAAKRQLSQRGPG